MLSPLISWILSPSSSSSSSSEEEEEQSLDITPDESDNENDNVVNEEDQNDNNMEDNENDEDDTIPIALADDEDDTIPIALAVPNASPTVTVAFPATEVDDKETVTATPTTAVVTRSKGQRKTTYSSLARQRLWTKQNETELLKGYLDYIKQQGKTTTSLQNDVASFYDQVIPKLNVCLNKNQLVEKLRRLKRKHKMILDSKGKDVKKASFKNSEEQIIFEISNKIWGNDIDHDVLDVDESRPVPESPDLIDNVKVTAEQDENKRVSKRLRLTTQEDEQKNGDDATATSIQGFIEETMRSCFSPLLKELLDDDEPLGGGALPTLVSIGEVEDDQLIKRRRILEMEVYLNRLELLQDQIKARLEELRSSLV